MSPVTNISSCVSNFTFHSSIRSNPDFPHTVQVNIDDGFLNLMTQDGVPKDDVKVPEGDLGKQIQDDFDAGKDLLVTIVSAMGEEQVSTRALYTTITYP